LFIKGLKQNGSECYCVKKQTEPFCINPFEINEDLCQLKQNPRRSLLELFYAFFRSSVQPPSPSHMFLNAD